MTPNLPDVRPGDPVYPAMRDLVRYERAEQLASGRNMRRRVMPNGTSYSADEAGQSWPHAWKVTLGDREVIVKPGQINGITPTIDRAPLTAEPAPRLKITGGPNEDRESWIALKVIVDPESGEINEEADDPVTIIHTNDLDALRTDIVGIEPLALIVWDSATSIRERVQGAILLSKHEYRKRDGTKPARHFFH